MSGACLRQERHHVDLFAGSGISSNYERIMDSLHAKSAMRSKSDMAFWLGLMTLPLSSKTHLDVLVDRRPHARNRVKDTNLSRPMCPPGWTNEKDALGSCRSCSGLWCETIVKCTPKRALVKRLDRLTNNQRLLLNLSVVLFRRSELAIDADNRMAVLLQNRPIISSDGALSW